MKTLCISILLSWAVIAPVVYGQPALANPKNGAPADEAAIKQVIADETDGYFARNRDKWANAWAHTPRIQWSGSSGSGEVLMQNGWDALSEFMGNNFTSGEPPRSGLKVQRDNYQINVLENVATTTFIQTMEFGGYKGTTKEVRVLEKDGNDWKLVYVRSRTTNQ